MMVVMMMMTIIIAIITIITVISIATQSGSRHSPGVCSGLKGRARFVERSEGGLGGGVLDGGFSGGCGYGGDGEAFELIGVEELRVLW